MQWTHISCFMGFMKKDFINPFLLISNLTWCFRGLLDSLLPLFITKGLCALHRRRFFFPSWGRQLYAIPGRCCKMRGARYRCVPVIFAPWLDRRIATQIHLPTSFSSCGRCLCAMPGRCCKLRGKRYRCWSVARSTWIIWCVALWWCTSLGIICSF